MHTVARAEIFLLGHARLLERRLFAHLFHEPDVAAVLAALRAYQNADGGFGNALEPDKRSPDGQPIDVEIALRVLRELGVAPQDMVLPACEFLLSISTPEGGVPFGLPSINQYPRAPWWAVDNDPPAALNPTASIVALLTSLRVEHPWIKAASSFCWRAIEQFDGDAFHDVMPVVMFLAAMSDDRRTEGELERIRKRIRGAVAFDRATPGYVKFPLDWAPRPDSPLRPIFEDAEIDNDLDSLAAAQANDGGWRINWDTITPAVEYEWRGWKTIEALTTLRAYGRLSSAGGNT